jgi:hypothetical protein
VVRWYVERQTGVQEESDVSSGTLFSSGLIAGGSLCGILYAVLVGTEKIGLFQSVGNAVPFLHTGTAGLLLGVALFFALAAILSRYAQRKLF